MNHRNPVVLVTGASRGIGRAIAVKFAREGYPVALCARGEDALLSAEKEIKAFGNPCISVTADVGDPKQCRLLFQTIKEKLGAPGIVINNAGISLIGLLQDMTDDQWDRILSTNLSSVFYCCRQAIPDMVNAGAGRILNISSVWGNVGASCEVAYSATKGGVNAFTKALAKELAPSRIQVNALACGAIDTTMNQFLTEEEKASLIEEIPADRLGTPEEAAETAFQLLTAPIYLTGQIVTLDGGWQ